MFFFVFFFFFSSRRRHTRFDCDWSSDVCSSDLFVAGWLAFWLAFGLSGIAIGLGAVYADFRLDNAARVAAGPAGMLFMVIATTFVFATIALLGPPVFLVLRADVDGLALSSMDHALIAAGLVSSAALCLAAAVLPVRRGARILWSRELPS